MLASKAISYPLSDNSKHQTAWLTGWAGIPQTATECGEWKWSPVMDVLHQKKKNAPEAVLHLPELNLTGLAQWKYKISIVLLLFSSTVLGSCSEMSVLVKKWIRFTRSGHYSNIFIHPINCTICGWNLEYIFVSYINFFQFNYVKWKNKYIQIPKSYGNTERSGTDSWEWFFFPNVEFCKDATLPVFLFIARDGNIEGNQ